MRWSCRRRSSGFTLVELLVVIAIIGVLIALLLPAVQSARESARRTTCTNQLKQFVTAALNHEVALRHYPTGGWGWSWVGDADRGFGEEQPGGWIYNILPFMEQKAKHDMPKDGKPNEHTEPQLEGARRMLIDPIEILYCPTRRNGKLRNTEKLSRFANNSAPNTPEERDLVGRSDYAANAGDYAIGGGVSGPGSLLTPAMVYPWFVISKTGLFDVDSDSDREPDGVLTGVSFQRSEVGVRHVEDGTSNTYFAGEKYLIIDNYETGYDTGDNETWCTGHNNDNLRTTAAPPKRDEPCLGSPKDCQNENGNIFGSAHATGWNVAWCDGHVQFMSYDIDPLVHKNNGNRLDGNVGAGQ
jgi:prepilin-type N-terminal cleavage/methylation domain-containing protein/prepilin-type processing-associated H-X9-DG protein